MRILQIIPTLSKGGAEKVVIEMSNSIASAGHNVHILLAHPLGYILAEKNLDRQVEVNFIDPVKRSRIVSYIKVPIWILQNRKGLREFDIIHCHLTYGVFFGFIAFVLRKIDRKLNYKLIATCHSIGVETSDLQRVFNERSSRFFDSFVLMAIDSRWRGYLERNSIRNIQVIFNGITPKLTKDKASHKNEKSYLVGTISRLQPERKPHLFLETFLHINQIFNRDIKFIIGGDGIEKESLMLLSEKLGLSQVTQFLGHVNDPDEVLKRLDVFITLSVEKITGIGGLEAVFSGVPVIGIQLSQNYDHGSKDWIWSDQSPERVAEHVVDLLSDRELLSNTSFLQRKVAKKSFTSKNMTDQYLALYNRMLS